MKKAFNRCLMSFSLLLVLFQTHAAFSQLPEIPEELRGKWVGTIIVDDQDQHREGTAVLGLSNFGYKVDGTIEVDWNFKKDGIRIPGHPKPVFSKDNSSFTTLSFEGSFPIRDSLTYGKFYFTQAYYNSISLLTGAFRSNNKAFNNTSVKITLLPKDYVDKATKKDKNFVFPVAESFLAESHKKNQYALFGTNQKDVIDTRIKENGQRMSSISPDKIPGKQSNAIQGDRSKLTQGEGKKDDVAISQTNNAETEDNRNNNSINPVSLPTVFNDKNLTPGVYTLRIKDPNFPQVCKLSITKSSATAFKFEYVGTGGPCDITLKGILSAGSQNTFVYKSPDRSNVFQVSTNGKQLNVKVIKQADDECALVPFTGIYKYSGEVFNLANLKGGSTPEELGQILLTALKTNDKKLWMSCVHPEQYNSFNEKRFDEFRGWLGENGVSDWSAVQFSRVVYQKSHSTTADKDKYLGYYIVEFYYQNKTFVGAFGTMTVQTYKGGNKYLIWFPGKDTRLVRQPKKIH